VEAARRSRVPVETGVFQAEMQVHLVNEGPVTIWIDTEERGRK
jgi:D-tyrosyl-tRNA(Tyr) deacylase